MTRIPSYDDLTPSIPDISVRETFVEVKRFLARSESPVGHAVLPEPVDTSSSLYACLRDSRLAGSRLPDPGSRFDRSHILIARDFSPRIECHGASSVVLDVSGLGRLLGDAQAIGAELARAANAVSPRLQISIARSQTAARRLTPRR